MNGEYGRRPRLASSVWHTLPSVDEPQIARIYAIWSDNKGSRRAWHAPRIPSVRFVLLSGRGTVNSQELRKKGTLLQPAGACRARDFQLSLSRRRAFKGVTPYTLR